MKLKLFSLCEFSKANSKGAQVVIGNILSLLKNVLAIEQVKKEGRKPVGLPNVIQAISVISETVGTIRPVDQVFDIPPNTIKERYSG